MKIFITLLTMLTGCAGVMVIPAPHCDKHELNGLYKVKTQELSGTCGSLGDFTVEFSQGKEIMPSSCVVEYDKWANRECSTSRKVTCSDTNTLVWTSELEEEDGGFRVLAGEVILESSGILGACTSKYYFTYTRE